MEKNKKKEEVEVRWQTAFLHRCDYQDLKTKSSFKTSVAVGWLDGKWGVEWVRTSDGKSFKIEQDPKDPQIFIFFDSIVAQMPEMNGAVDGFLKDILKELE